MNLRVFQIEKREEKILQLTKLFNVYHPYKILETEMVIYTLHPKIFTGCLNAPRGLKK